jgi:CheY-like chemotaxis protein
VAAAGAEHADSPRKLRVLVADDHPLALRMATRLLQLHGFAVTPVADGAAALAALQAAFPAHSAGGTPAAAPIDLALLDMDMPVLSGSDCSAAFREWDEAARLPGEPRLPIAALTANVAVEHAHTCAAAGMTIFLAKPLRAADISLLRAHAASFSEARAVAEAAAAALPAAVAASQAAAAVAASAHAVLGMPFRLGQL